MKAIAIVAALTIAMPAIADPVYVARRDGKITGAYLTIQPGTAEAAIDDAAPEYVASGVALSPRDARVRAFQKDKAGADMLAKLRTSQPAEIDAYVDKVATVAQLRELMKAVLKAIAIDPR